MTHKLIVALDFDDQNEALVLVEKLDPAQCALKVGHEMFTRWGSDFVRRLIARSFKVFLDLKFHDIPNTVKQACIAGAELGVWMMNVHASGGFPMMIAAREGVDECGSARPLLIAVTVLTSMDEMTLASVGVPASIPDHVGRLALLAHDAGLDGVVCSALEVPQVKALCGLNFLAITPGIRLACNTLDDQTRVMTPALACNAGSDYLVVGRPITRAAVPMDVVREILHVV